MTLHDEWHDPFGVQDVSTAIDYIGELERGAEEAADYIEKQQQEIESLREKRDEWKRRAIATAEEVAYLIDHYQHGIKYDEKLNVQVCVWTKRQIEQAEKDAEKMMKKLKWFKEE